MGALESSADLTDGPSCGSFNCTSAGDWTLLGHRDDRALSIAEEPNFLDSSQNSQRLKNRSSESLEGLG